MTPSSDLLDFLPGLGGIDLTGYTLSPKRVFETLGLDDPEKPIGVYDHFSSDPFVHVS